MPFTLHTCPTRERIEQFLNGALSEGDFQEMEQHFNQCQPCGDTVRAIISRESEETLLGEFRLADRLSHSEEVDRHQDHPLVIELIRRLQAEGLREVSPRAVAEEERAAEVLCQLDVPDSADSLGKLAHYELYELLGSGSTGVVFAATDRRLQRDVAIKILRPSLGSAAQERFLLEARTAATIQHENVMTIFDVGQANGMAYFTMPWTRGMTLEDRLSSVSFLPEQEVRELARQICLALAAAHKKNIVHRDIKPANIWIDSERSQVKLLDFGLARVADADPQRTASGILAGTPCYMSPEQARGQELDARSDLFSLGCVLYRCTTGRLPFSSTGILATLQAIQNDTPPRPDQLNPVCSAEWSDLIMCLLEKQPDRRPSSARDVLAALDLPPHRWPFQSAGLGQAIANHALLSSRRKTKSRAGRWITVCVGIALAGLAGYQFGPDVVRIATNQGEIAIQCDDPAVQIEVLQDGHIVRVVDTATQRELTLAAGRYSLRPGIGDGEFVISPDSIVLVRGGKQIVRITKKPNEAPSAVAKQATAPTYNGRSFAKWIATLKTERNVEIVCEGIRAMAELAAENPGLREQALNAVTPFVRVHGSRIYEGRVFPGMGNANRSTMFHDAFTVFFSSLPPEDIVRFIKQEILEGTRASREHLVWFSLVGNLYGNNLDLQGQLHQSIHRGALEICQAWLQVIAEMAQANDRDGIRTLRTLANSVTFWQPANLNLTVAGMWSDDQTPVASKELQELFTAAYATAPTWDQKLAIADFFFTFRLDYPSDFSDVIARLSDDHLSNEQRWQCLEVVWRFSARHGEKIIPLLVRMGQSIREDFAESGDVAPSDGLPITGVTYRVVAHHDQIRFPGPSSNTWNVVIFAAEPPFWFSSIFSGFLNLGGGEQYHIYLEPREMAELVIIWLLSRYEKVPSDVATPAVAWLKTLLAEADSSDLLKPNGERVGPGELTDADRRLLVKLTFNHFIARAIRVLQTGVAEEDPSEAIRRIRSGGLF